MVELNASCGIITTARQTKYYLPISDAEMDYVSEHEMLNDCERLVWLKIAQKSALAKNLSCVLTLVQLGKMLRKKPDTIYRAIRNLKRLGFLKTYYKFGDRATLYYLTLPSDGLAAVLAAPVRGGKRENNEQGRFQTFYISPEHYPDNPGELSGTLPDKNPPLLISNNNKNINHNSNIENPTAEPCDSSQVSVLDADALLCEYEILQEKYKALSPREKGRTMASHFPLDDLIKIERRKEDLRAIEASKATTATQDHEFKEKLAQATTVPPKRINRPNLKLVEFEFEGEQFLVEEKVRDQILNVIPNLHQQNQILGEAGKKSIKTLIAEIFYYVAKAGSKALDACQLKRFYTARKLCLNGAWERPNGLERQSSLHREHKWQQAKEHENKFAKELTTELMQNVA